MNRTRAHAPRFRLGFLLVACLVAAAPALAGSCPLAMAPPSPQPPAPPDLVDTAVSAGSFKTLATALTVADLVKPLKGPGPFTVFAPTDEAFAKLPQGQPERWERALKMVEEMDRQGFGNCTNYLECEAVCPKRVSIINIARLNREYVKAGLLSSEK